jgi:hypothetical protein
MRRIRIFVLFCDGTFRDVFASFSEAVRESHGPCCEIREYDRDEY